MHELTFSDALCQRPATVFGLPLLPFTLGHELILWQRRNPFVLYHASAITELPDPEKARALTQAVMLCCRRRPWLTRRWSKKCRRMDLIGEIEKFMAYRKAGGQDLPTVRMPKAQGTPFHYFGGPELAQLINYITEFHEVMVRTHFAGSPLNFPLGLARQLYQVHAECQGNLWIENYFDQERARKVEAFEKANPESTFAKGHEAVQALAEKWNREHPEAPVPLMFAPKDK